MFILVVTVIHRSEKRRNNFIFRFYALTFSLQVLDVLNFVVSEFPKLFVASSELLLWILLDLEYFS